MAISVTARHLSAKVPSTPLAPVASWLPAHPDFSGAPISGSDQFGTKTGIEVDQYPLVI